ncbi:MAG: quinone oxidoreductase [Gammaproteobacteria bacterium]
MVTRAIVLHEFGGPEQLRLEETALDDPGAGEVLIRQTGIGVNYIDTYYRRGIYPLPLPAIIGDQATGVIELLGDEVSGFAIGDRVAYCGGGQAYVERRTIAADKLVKLPAELDDDVVSSSLLRGLTAEYLLCRLHAVQPGESVVVHAAAGGTGLIVCQWAKHLGATVIATVGASAKEHIARDAGADHVLLHDDPDFVARVRELTGGRGVDVVYDSIGLDTFMDSLACLRPRGLMVAYGNASGKPAPLDVLALAGHGSLFLTRPRLTEYIATRADLEASAARYFDVLVGGVVRPHPVQHFALAEAAAAHRHLEDRAALRIPVLVP